MALQPQAFGEGVQAVANAPVVAQPTAEPVDKYDYVVFLLLGPASLATLRPAYGITARSTKWEG
ncbi:hypothetical protein PG995_006238 [Apiospora arundinis]